MVEGVFLRRPHGGLQRLGQPRDGRFHHVDRGRHSIVHRCPAGHYQPLKSERGQKCARALLFTETAMSNPITITCAPCCWGVDDVKNPHLPPWERVLDEAAQAGFGGLELGPYGYIPLDV